MTTRVHELMHHGLITCAPDLTLGQAARRLQETGIHALVVADPHGVPLGVLSDFDLLTGEWLSGDALAPTLRPLLERIGRDAIPLILASARAFETWADQNPTTGELPRAVGTHPTSLRGIHFERLTTPYTLWMVQRVLGEYRRLGTDERAAVDRALAGTGCEAALAYTPRHRVERRPFKLHLAR